MRNKKKFLLSLIMILSFILILTGCVEDLISGQIGGKQTGSINGTVKDGNDKAISGAKVSVGNKSDNTNEDGNFLIEDLEVGSYSLVITAEDFEKKEEDISIDSGSNNLGDIKMEKEGEENFGSEYQGANFIKTNEGFGIKYSIIDEVENIDSEVWAVSQYVNHNDYDFVYSLNGDENLNSTLGGINRSLTNIKSGFPVKNQARFYMFFNLPYEFSSGDTWEDHDTKYEVEYIGSYKEFNNCVKIHIDNTKDPEYNSWDGTGYIIAEKDLGIVEVYFDRTNAGEVKYEYIEHKQLNEYTISGKVVDENGEGVENITIGPATTDFGNQDITDSNGNFTNTTYGPLITLHLFQDGDRLGEYFVDDVENGGKDLEIDISSF